MLHNIELQQEETLFTFHVVYIHTFSTRPNLSIKFYMNEKLMMCLPIESLTMALFLSEGWGIGSNFKSYYIKTTNLNNITESTNKTILQTS